MKTVFADFNAMTETEHLCLTTRGSRDDLERLGVRAGEWAWFSDGEMVVGAQVDHDSRYGTVAIPDWKTLVHLDDPGTQDFLRVRDELSSLLARNELGVAEQWRVFQLLTIFERIAPAQALEQVRPGYFAFRRAATLLQLGEPDLASIEIQEARRLSPGQANDDYLFLEILRQTDLPRAVQVARDFVSNPDLDARVMAECIHVLATHADQLGDGPFRSIAEAILKLIERFHSAPSRERILAMHLALVQFNQGLILLRLGQLQDAQRSLRMAHTTNPISSEINQASYLTSYDDGAREITARLYALPLPAYLTAA